MLDSVPPRKTQAKMNVLYTSQKHDVFCENHPTKTVTHTHASGDCHGVPGRCCRLCSGDTNLRYLGDTYVWEGIEERYDQLLYDCFGIRVTAPDCMICEWCVRALRSTERFRALVHAAFDHPESDASSTTSTTLKSEGHRNCECGKHRSRPSTRDRKPVDLAKRRETRKRLVSSEAKVKRTNIPCDICRQRYPMLVPNDGHKTFICSRCKKNGEVRGSSCKKCNISTPPNTMKDVESHAKPDLRGKPSVQHGPKPRPTKKAQIVPVCSQTRRQKYQCSRCPKKYAVARNLALHVRNAHGDSHQNFCSVCGQTLESLEKLEEHLKEHPGVPNLVLHQCEECLLIFKNRKSLQTHSLTHHNKCNSNCQCA